MRIKGHYKVRQVAGENLVVNQGQTHEDMTKIISLNSTALLLWNELQGKDFTVKQAADILVQHFGISEEVAMADASHWADALLKHGIIS